MMANINIISSVAGKVSSMLLEVEAIKLNPRNPFTWSSGLKSPIYCDNRLSLSFPNIRNFIKDELAGTITENFPGVDIIAGVATAGIPQGALLADKLQLPFIYVRASPKSHGMANLIEGKVMQGKKVVVVEDLVSTGGSSLKAVEAIRNSGMEVLGMVAIFSYGFESAEANFKQANIPLYCLSDYNHLLKEAKEKSYIKESELESLNSWRNSPEEWQGKVS